MKPTRKCTIDGCDKTGPYVRGWCQMHYTRWKRHGSPFAVSVFSNPEESFAARTEWRGDCLIWTGAQNNHGYGQIAVAGKMIYTHRYAWEREHGPIPRGMHIDHRDHCDPACCNVEHLRVVTRSQNMRNRSGARVDSESGARNVRIARNGKYHVRVWDGTRSVHVGTYDSLAEASTAESNARKVLFGEFAGRG